MYFKKDKISAKILRKSFTVITTITFLSSIFAPLTAYALDFGTGGLDIGGSDGGAGIPGIDFGNGGLDIGGAGDVTGGESGIDFSGALNEVPTKDKKVRWFGKEGYLKEFGKDKIAYMFANRAIESISASIVDWINSGFEGKPAFVQDLKRHFANIESEILGSYLNEIGAGFLCSPFADKIKRSLEIRLAISQAGGRYAKESLFRSTNQCTLDDVLTNIGTSLEEFSNDFSRGGWPAWTTMIQTQNHELGAYLVVRNELFRRQNEAVVNAKAELNFGQGFLSWKKCTPSVSSSDSTPGIDFNDAVSGNTDSTPGIDFSGNSAPGLFTSTEFGQDCQIVTPGSVIEDQLNEALGSGQRRLEAADEINEIVDALFSQLINQALGGIQGLFGASQASASNPSYTNQIRQNDSNLDSIKRTFLIQIDDSLRDLNRTIYIKEVSINDINSTLTYMESLNQCLASRRDSGTPDTLGEQNYTQNKAQLETVKADLINDINKLNTIKDRLLSLANELQGDITLERADEITTEYSEATIPLSEATDPDYASNELENLRGILSLVRQETQTDLLRCQQFNTGFTF